MRYIYNFDIQMAIGLAYLLKITYYIQFKSIIGTKIFNDKQLSKHISINFKT